MYIFKRVTVAEYSRLVVNISVVIVTSSFIIFWDGDAVVNRKVSEEECAFRGDRCQQFFFLMFVRQNSSGHV